MRSFRLFLILIIAATARSPSASFAADDDPAREPVSLAWFPRFSPDGKWLITAHGNWEQGKAGEVRVWEAATGKPRFVIPSDRGVRSVGWSPKGKFFASGGYGNVVRLYDSETGKQFDEIKFPGTVEVLQITPDEKRLVTAHGGGAVRVTELASKKRLQSWDQVHAGGIWGAALSPNGKTLATAGRDGFVRIFDLGGSRILHELKHPADTNGVAFTHDGKFLCTGCGDSKIRIFDAAQGTELRTLVGHEEGSVTDMQFSMDDKLLATCGMDRTVRLWDMTDFERPTLTATLNAHDGLVFGVAISPKGEWLASAGWDDRVKMWDRATRKEIWSWQP
ncbi:MAG TPA: WD40 repeat domain-containing protein [Planctomycetaceae bacterium]